MGNLLLGAALQGLGGAGEAYGNVMLKSELEREKRLEDFRFKQELQREMLAGREASGGGRGGSFNPKTVQAQLETGVGVQPGGLPAYEEKLNSGSLFDQARTIDSGWPADSGAKQTADVIDRPQGWEALQARKQADLKSLREAIATGGDYEDLTKGRLNEQKRDQLDQYQGGNDRAGQAALIGDGKDVYGGNSDVTRNQVTGKTNTTDVGKADVKKKGAEASEALAKAEKARTEAEAGGGVKGASVERLSTQLNAVNAAIKDLTDDMKQPNRQDKVAVAEHAKALKTYRTLQAKIAAAMDERIGDKPSTPKPPKPASTLNTLPPGAKQIGTSGGKPVYQTPDGKKFIQG